MTKSHQSDIRSEIGREGALLTLLVPLLNPGVGADGPEVLIEELARLVLFTLQYSGKLTSKSATTMTSNDGVTWVLVQFTQLWLLKHLVRDINRYSRGK